MPFAIEYLLACLLMGAAIGMDVAIVTALYSQQLACKQARKRWISGVVGSHTFLPMCGYLLSFYGIKWLPWFTPLLGIIAAGFIAIYLYQELYQEEQGADPIISTISWSLIIAVSWDALWSGPAKSAQVVDWQTIYVWTSFVLVGAVVYLFTLAGLNVGKRFSKQHTKTPFLWLWLQYSAIAYFAMLALTRYTFELHLAQWLLFLIAICFVRILLCRQKPLTLQIKGA